MQIIVEDLHRNMEQRKMAKKLDRILNYYNTKKGKPEKMQQLPHNIFNKSSKQSTTVLQIVLSRLKAQAESIMAEEQTGFRAGRSTTEQILNLRILNEKYKIGRAHV